MLCNTCDKLPPPTNVAGSCKKCSGQTAFFAYKLCDDCSEKLDQCERCECPISAPVPTASGSPSVYSVVLSEKDDGKTITGLNAGDEIIVTLEEDQYSQTEWGPAMSAVFALTFRLKANNGFIPYIGQYQKGTRELIFEVKGSGNAVLEIEEKVRQHSWYSSNPTPSSTPAPNGKKWQVIVQSS